MSPYLIAQMRVHRRVYHIPMRCKSCRTFYTRSGERMSRHEVKCEAAASAAAAAKRRHFQAPEDAGDVSVQKGRAMPADEDYGETVQELNAAKAAAAATTDDGSINSSSSSSGFKCAECSFAHSSFAAVFGHTASAHALRFRAVTSDLRVMVRKGDVEAANAQLARDMAERSRQRRFMCRVCNFEDVTMPALKAHLKTHTVAEKLAAKRKIRQQAQQQAALRIKTEVLEPSTASCHVDVDASDNQVQEKVPDLRPEPPQTDASKKLVQVSAAKPRVEEQPKTDASAEEPSADPEIVFRCNKCNFKASNVVDIKKHKGEAHPKKAKNAKKKGASRATEKSGKRTAVKEIKFAARKKAVSAKGINNIKREVVASDEVQTPPPTKAPSAKPPPPPPPPPMLPTQQQKDSAAAATAGTMAKGAKEPTLYRCKICLFRAPTANEVKIHLRQAHPNRKALLRTMNGANNLKSGPAGVGAPVKSEPGTAAAAATMKEMKCGRCEFSTAALPELKQHVLNVHPTQERQVTVKAIKGMSLRSVVRMRMNFAFFSSKMANS